MGLTPTTPNFSPKSFWDRPEGTTGKLMLAAMIVGGGVAAWIFLPVLITFFAMLAELATNIVYLVIMVAVLIGLLYVITNKTFQNLLKNIFQSLMRHATGVFIEIDPIGILDNNLDQMNDQKLKLDTAVGKIKGSVVSGERSIAAKTADVTHIKNEVDILNRQIPAERDPDKARTLNLTLQSKKTEAGLKMGSIDRLQTLLNQAKKMYNLGLRWRDLAEFQITNTRNQRDILAEERKQILAMTEGMGAMQKLLKGDPEQLKMVNQTLEFLADDSAAKLGALEDFANFSEKYLSNMDLENGAAAEDADHAFADFEQKMLSAGSQGPSIIDMARSNAGVYESVPRAGAGASSSKYDEL